MARLDPNQAAAAATGEPIPGADPLGQPVIDMQTPAPPAGTGPTQAEIDAAIGMGLNPNTMSSDEWEFIDTFVHGGLASIQPDGDPENPLIPAVDGPAEGTPIPPTIPTEPAADAPPPATGEGRVGPATDPDGGGGNVAPAATSTAPEVIETPGRPAFEIPNTIPAAPAPPEPAPTQQPNLVTLPDGSIVTVETYQALLAAQQQQQPFAQQQPTPQYVAPPPMAPAPPMQPQGFVPNAWAPTPGEYVDERAAFEITALQQQIAQQNAILQQTQLQTAAAIEAQHANTRQALDVAVEETLHGYAGARQISYDQADDLLQTATRLGLVGVYSEQFPGDPRRAVAAAIENVYNNTPEFRQLEIQRQIEATRLENEDVERKKAFAGQTTGTPGSVPRAAAPAGSAAERTQGMVAMIESDPAYQAQQASRR